MSAINSTKGKAQAPMRRGFRLLFILQGFAFAGLRLKQIAEALQESPCTALRDLSIMAEEGIVERIPGAEECWRLSPKLAQIAVAHYEEMQRVEQRVAEINQRYTRTQ
jgi:DNA-binding IclR family transcriptional regulator